MKLKNIKTFEKYSSELNISDVINNLLKEMTDRLQYLKTLEESDENTGRIKEMTNCIVRIQQIGLNYL